MARGSEDLYRLRVGDYRIIYAIRDESLLVLVVRVGTWGEVYERILKEARRLWSRTQTIPPV